MRKIYCWLCDKGVERVYTSFFHDKKGKYRYGSICPKCYFKKELNVPPNLKACRKKNDCFLCIDIECSIFPFAE
jgi:hypothetical protein